MNSDYQASKGLYKSDLKDQTLWIQFDHEKDTNPFSRRLTIEITKLSKAIDGDDRIKSVIFTGGIGRSFCSGGDFNDVQKLKEPEETRTYLYEIIDLYQALLSISKPTISLVDHYAIGQGLQVALMTDFKIASDRAQISMPELKNGVACPLGATILENYFGHGLMLEDVVGCSMMNAKQALEKRYFNQICPSEKLFEVGAALAKRFNEYPSTPYQMTKKIFNQKLYTALEDVRIPAGEAHIETVLAQSAQRHFKKILGKD